jgi:hypothetical protein
MDKKKTTRQVRFANNTPERLSPPPFSNFSHKVGDDANAAAALEQGEEGAAAKPNVASPHPSEKESSDSKEDTLVGNYAFNFDDFAPLAPSAAHAPENWEDDDGRATGGAAPPRPLNPDDDWLGNTHGALTDFNALDPHTTRFKTGNLTPNIKYKD